MFLARGAWALAFAGSAIPTSAARPGLDWSATSRSTPLNRTVFYGALVLSPEHRHALLAPDIAPAKPRVPDFTAASIWSSDDAPLTLNLRSAPPQTPSARPATTDRPIASPVHPPTAL